MSASPAPASAEDVAARRAGILRAGGLIVGLVAVLAVTNVATHGDFLAPGNVVNILRQIAVNAILATGQTFVIITAGIDLSVGSLVALTGVLMAGVLSGHFSIWVGLTLAVAVGLGVGAVCGMVNGYPVVKFN